MLVIKVWCVPRIGEEKLREFRDKLVHASVSVARLGLREEDVVVLFPADMRKQGLGEEILIEVTDLAEDAEHHAVETRNSLAAKLGRCVRKQFPKAAVQCGIFPFRPDCGLWTSTGHRSSFQAAKHSTPLETRDPAVLLASVDELDIALSTKNYLKADNMPLIGNVAAHTARELLMTPGIGRKQLNEIERALASKSVYLPD